MIPRPHEQFRAFERPMHRPALNAPFTCNHVHDEREVYAVDAMGNPRVFVVKTWAFEQEAGKEN